MQRVISTGGKRNAQRPENEHSEMIDECTRNVFYRIHWWEYVSVSREANNFFINQHDWKTVLIFGTLLMLTLASRQGLPFEDHTIETRNVDFGCSFYEQLSS